MKVRKHFFVNNDHCVFCGALYWPKLQKLYSDRGQAVPQTDERTCIERDDHIHPKEMRPEPKARQYACDDVDTIKAAIDALRATPVEQSAAEQQSSAEWGIYYKLLHLSEKSIG